MNILLDGTRFFGIHMVKGLLATGHKVTVATRGNTADFFGDKVKRIQIERTSAGSMKNAFSDQHYDAVIDKIAYCSNDIKYAMYALHFDKYIYMSTTAVYEPKHLNTKECEFDGLNRNLEWCARFDHPYDETKRQAECALRRKYSERNWFAGQLGFKFSDLKDWIYELLDYYIIEIARQKTNR